MAYLQVSAGEGPERIIELTGERMVLGRHPSCEIMLDDAAISRHHAQILESHGSYYLEDLRSRNHTFLNGQMVEGRKELYEGDRIKVCDVDLTFHLESAATGADRRQEETAAPRRPRAKPSDQKILSDAARPISFGESPSDTSSIISTLDAKSSSSLRLKVNPEAKLRAVMEISNALAKILNIDEVLETTLEGLFKIFPQADEGFALLNDRQNDRLAVRATKSRRAEADAAVQVSMTIVRQAMRTSEAILSADAAEDARFEPSESLANLKIRSMMCVPLLGKSGVALGVLQITSRDLAHPFGQGELDMLVSVASQVSLAVENANMHEDLLKQRDLERDLEFATQVQIGFLPNQRPKIEGFQFSDYYEAALRVGGDYFDYIQLPDDRVVVAVGDVAGKGIPAALLMARLYPSARYHLFTQPTPAAALSALNSEINCSGLGHRFITFMLAIVDPRAREVRIVNAGHWPPLLRRSRGGVEELGRQNSGLPLGVVREQEFQETSLGLEPGDVLALYTDGITEAVSPSGETYSTERLAQLIGSGPNDADELLGAIIADVEEFSQMRQQKDDMCLVCLRRCK